MTRLLDARTSQNASIAGSMNGAGLTANQNVLIGQIGLTTAGSQGPIRVQFNGVATFFVFSGGFITLNLFVVRGSAATDPIVASNRLQLNPGATTPTNLFPLYLIGSDYNPAPADEIIYSLFVNSTVNVNRVGPESFNGCAYSD
ncbi:MULTISPECIES: hypothetical protein [Paenibacillus]|uniref:Exosporium leader peptide n=1 Tax=Paenibacillus borealis TaxID=160799 RepID=A0ABX3GR21_PAEBO|nr:MULTISPECIES: hypothetical protein [Paenibacillus]AIQ15675.1 hypothetical protein H70357_02390 [Paenibacillus sp. FSL H7-0357]OMD35143.1 hypothetical protein BSK56_33230 [Paenibacillus borealis]